MEFKNRNLRILKMSLQSGYLFHSELSRIFAGSKHLRFKMLDECCMQMELTPMEEQRFLCSILTDDYLSVYDYQPDEIIKLTKEMKVSLIKCIATNGFMPKNEVDEIFIKTLLAVSDICSKEEFNIPNYRTLKINENE